MVKIIVDPGSTHMGKFSYIKELCDVAKEAGVDIIKWQLFKGNENGNIEFPRKLWGKTIAYCREIKLNVFASVFDDDAIHLLQERAIHKAKLAYSQCFNLGLIKHLKKHEFEIWASGDLNHWPSYADVKFFCVPEYPIKKKFHCLDGLAYFDGFSSHYLGWQEDKRVMKKAKLDYLEKHITLDHADIKCPDSEFALNAQELKKLCQELK